MAFVIYNSCRMFIVQLYTIHDKKKYHAGFMGLEVHNLYMYFKRDKYFKKQYREERF